jgi:hypothetical protein
MISGGDWFSPYSPHSCRNGSEPFRTDFPGLAFSSYQWRAKQQGLGRHVKCAEDVRFDATASFLVQAASGFVEQTLAATAKPETKGGYLMCR